MSRVVVLAGLVLSFAGAGDALAAGWVKAPGETYLKLGGGAFWSSGYWELDGDFVETPALEYRNQSVQLYLEVGLVEGVALGLGVPLVFASNTDVFGIEYRRSSLGDLDAFVQLQLLRDGPWALSAQLLFRAPLYEGVLTGVNQQTGWVSDSLPELSEFFPALGDGSIDVLPTVQLGHALSFVPGWITGEVGPRFRSRGFGATLNYALGAGVYVWPDRLALTARLSGWQRFSADHAAPTSNLFTVAGGALVPIAWGLSFELEGSYVPAGSFVARGGGVVAGISYRGSILPGG